MSIQHRHDLVILGGGPAGLSAAIYATRAGITPLVIERESFGGQIVSTDEVDNYPGLVSVSGSELGERLRSHAEHLGAQFVYDDVESIARAGDTGEFILRGSEEVHCSSLIYAAGAAPRRAGFAGEQEFLGRGVSYCATCDGMFYRGKQAYVIGGGNTACEEALYLSKLASRVVLLVRGDHLRAVRSLANAVEQEEKIKVRYLTRLVELSGDDSTGSTLPCTLKLSIGMDASAREEVVEAAPGSFGVFVAVGREPRTQLLKSLVHLDHTGYVLTDDSMATSTPGLFCAGDVRAKPLRQVVTAVSDGAIAAMSAASFLG